MAKKFFDIIPPKKAESFPKKLEFEKETKLDLVGDYGNREEAQKEQKKSSILGRKKKFFLKGLIFCLVFLILAGVFSHSLFSKVKIEIWPEIEILTFKETITINLKIEHPDFEAKVIPGKIFSDQKSNSQEFPSSGKVLKEEKAAGVMRVYNAYSTSSRILIPSRFVSADGKLFWSVKRIVIPGGRYEKGKLVPGEIDVEVQAAEPGEDYNIKSSTFALPALAGSPLYTTVYGKSFSSMTGGFKGEISQVSQEDLEKARNVLAKELKEESRNFLRKTLPTDFILLDETVSQEIVEENYSAGVGVGAESFNLQIQVKSEGMGFKKSDIENFAENFISLNISEDKKFQEESLEINYSPELIDVELGKIILNLEVKAKIYSDIDFTKLKKALSGKSFKEIKIFLENLTQISKIELKSRPFLKRKVPENIERIELKLNLSPSP